MCKHCVTFASHGSCLNPFKSTTSPTVSAVGPSSFQSSLSLSAQHKETLQIRTHTTISSPTACNPPLCAPNLFSAPYPSLLSTAKPRTTTQLQKWVPRARHWSSWRSPWQPEPEYSWPSAPALPLPSMLPLSWIQPATKTHTHTCRFTHSEHDEDIDGRRGWLFFSSITLCNMNLWNRVILLFRVRNKTNFPLQLTAQQRPHHAMLHHTTCLTHTISLIHSLLMNSSGFYFENEWQKTTNIMYWTYWLLI